MLYYYQINILFYEVEKKLLIDTIYHLTLFLNAKYQNLLNYMKEIYFWLLFIEKINKFIYFCRTLILF